MNAFLKKQNLHYNIKDYKFGLVIPVVVLAVFGVFMVYSARPDLMSRQVLGVLLGIVAMIVISLIDYRWILNLYWPLYFLNIVLLAAIWIPGLGGRGKPLPYRVFKRSQISRRGQAQPPNGRLCFSPPQKQVSS